MPYPRRTTDSDLYASLIVAYLTEVAAPQNYMVCVVTTVTGEVFAAPSGSGDRILNQGSVWQGMLQKVVWWRDIERTKSGVRKDKKAARKAIDPTLSPAARAKAERIRDDAAQSVRAQPGAIKARMADVRFARYGATHEEDPGQGGAPSTVMNNAALSAHLTSTNPKQLAEWDDEQNRLGSVPRSVVRDLARGRRDCAEPRALEMAAASGAKITGMTTVWYGSAEHPGYAPYRDDLQLADVDIMPAFPCDDCRANEARVMAAVDVQTSQVATRPRRHSIGAINYTPAQ